MIKKGTKLAASVILAFVMMSTLVPSVQAANPCRYTDGHHYYLVREWAIGSKTTHPYQMNGVPYGYYTQQTYRQLKRCDSCGAETVNDYKKTIDAGTFDYYR